MAQRHITVYIDDLTGKELPDGAAETVSFSLDGVEYELDTTIREAQRLRKTLGSYVSVGRGGGEKRPAVKRRTKTPASPAAVRAWATAHGIKVSARGRIPAGVIASFETAGN